MFRQWQWCLLSFAPIFLAYCTVFGIHLLTRDCDGVDLKMMCMQRKKKRLRGCRPVQPLEEAFAEVYVDGTL